MSVICVVRIFVYVIMMMIRFVIHKMCMCYRSDDEFDLFSVNSIWYVSWFNVFFTGQHFTDLISEDSFSFCFVERVCGYLYSRFVKWSRFMMFTLISCLQIVDCHVIYCMSNVQGLSLLMNFRSFNDSRFQWCISSEQLHEIHHHLRYHKIYKKKSKIILFKLIIFKHDS